MTPPRCGRRRSHKPWRGAVARDTRQRERERDQEGESQRDRETERRREVAPAAELLGRYVLERAGLCPPPEHARRGGGQRRVDNQRVAGSALGGCRGDLPYGILTAVQCAQRTGEGGRKLRGRKLPKGNHRARAHRLDRDRAHRDAEQRRVRGAPRCRVELGERSAVRQRECSTRRRRPRGRRRRRQLGGWGTAVAGEGGRRRGSGFRLLLRGIRSSGLALSPSSFGCRRHGGRWPRRRARDP